MNRINKLFSNRKKDLLSIYFTAGFPELHSTTEILHSLKDSKVDLIEIGMPYSDPLADGPVIQESSSIAIANGMSIPVLFKQLTSFHEQNRNCEVPLILMGYLNPVMQFGIEKFCAVAKATGISGIILPDLPPEIYESTFSKSINEHNLRFIFLITPETSLERIRKIDAAGSGFLYAVSSSSVTGRKTSIAAREEFLKKLKGLTLKNPVLTGFGIRDKASFKTACKYTSGGIIGTAFIEALKNGPSVEKATKKFIESIRTAGRDN